MKKSFIHLILLTSIVLSLINSLNYRAFLNGFDNDYLKSNEYRAHDLTISNLKEIRALNNSERGTWIAEHFSKHKIKKKYHKHPVWCNYKKYCDAIWNDIKYFPIPHNTRSDDYYVTYENSWQFERTYGGKRGHEGCDLIASIDIPGIIPVISATDGKITSKGWLEQGGYRIGITSPSGGYFYYAHLDSYTDFEIGDYVNAGDIIGFMGNSGYGPEGTTGMFVTHLHFGIYIYPNDTEISINPYWILKMIEEKKLFCSF